MAITLFKGATAVAVGDPQAGTSIASMSLQGVVAGTGAVSATVIVEGSNNATDWIAIATLNLTGTTRGTDGGAVNTPPWGQIRGRITAISGTNAAVDVVAVTRSAGYGA